MFDIKDILFTFVEKKPFNVLWSLVLGRKYHCPLSEFDMKKGKKYYLGV